MAQKPITTSSSQKRRLHAAKKKEIEGVVIFGRFISCLKLKANIALKTKISVILGGGLQKWDLGLKLMGFPPFMEEGLILQKVDVQNSQTIGELGDLVYKWYRSNGWQVV